MASAKISHLLINKLFKHIYRVESEKGETKIELRIKRIEYLDETESKELVRDIIKTNFQMLARP